MNGHVNITRQRPQLSYYSTCVL